MAYWLLFPDLSSVFFHVKSVQFTSVDYADTVYQNTADSILNPLNVLNNSQCRFVLMFPFRTHHCLMYGTFNRLHPKPGLCKLFDRNGL